MTVTVIAPTRSGRMLAWAVGLVLWLSGLAAAQPTPLTWAADEEGGAPYIFPDPDRPGENKGFEVELAELLAREIGRPILWKHYEFNALFTGLKRGDFDFAMNGLEVLPERLGNVRFSRPYYRYYLQLAVRRDEKRFHSLGELRGRNDLTIGTLEGAAAERVLADHAIGHKSYTGQTELYRELAGGRIDGIYIDNVIHSQYLPRFPGLRLAGEPSHAGWYAIAFRPADEALAQQIDEALRNLLDRGALQKLYEKWNLWNEAQEELATFTRYAEAAAAESWPITRYFPMLLEGAWLTVQITIGSMALAVALGLPVALMRLYGPAPVRWLAIGYVEFFRGIPVLLLLFFLYYGLSDMGIQLNAMTAAVLGFGINYAAYEAEIYRAGISSIPRGQWEAAAALGMAPALTFRRIILPQAMRSILPPMTNDFVALFKDTSVVSIIALEELTKKYQILSKTSFKYIEIGLLTAALYLLMSIPLGYLSRWLEQRWGVGH